MHEDEHLLTSLIAFCHLQISTASQEAKGQPAPVAGASALAQTLCSPPPLRPGGRPQLGGGSTRCSLNVVLDSVVRSCSRWTAPR